MFNYSDLYITYTSRVDSQQFQVEFYYYETVNITVLQILGRQICTVK